ncbi:MAG TPA: hypothetical protein VJL34_13040 [Anaerolineales bacterium]|nr:hypothetical protein [Anaerolineales bacterium]
MSLADLSLVDMIGALVSFGLTLMVFSYVFGDNVLFRIAIHLFIGVSAGYAAIVTVYNVIWPQLLIPLVFGSQSERLYVLIPLVLAGLLFFKVTPRFSALGNPSAAYLVGAGMAAAVGGAVIGTIFPQVAASANLFDFQAAQQAGGLGFFVKGVAILLGTLTTLIYFHYGVQPSPGGAVAKGWLGPLSWIGQMFIAITLGAVFAGVYSAALMAFIERVYFVGDILLPLLFNP